jgi:hypothetical protein
LPLQAIIAENSYQTAMIENAAVVVTFLVAVIALFRTNKGSIFGLDGIGIILARSPAIFSNAYLRRSMCRQSTQALRPAR